MTMSVSAMVASRSVDRFRHSGMVRKHQTRNLEIRGSLVSLAPRNDIFNSLSKMRMGPPRQVRIWVSAPRIARRIALCSIAPFRRERCRVPAPAGVQTGVFMHSPDPPVVTEQPSVSRNRLVLVLYTSAIFVSALLLFSVQPLFTKMVLPRLGGSPAGSAGGGGVFQALALAGHRLERILVDTPRRLDSVGVHLGS